MESVTDGSVSGAVVRTGGTRADAVRPRVPGDAAVVTTPSGGSTGQVRRAALLAAAGTAAFALAYAFAPRDGAGLVVEASNTPRPRQSSAPPRAGDAAPLLKRVARAEIAATADADPFVGASFVPPKPPPAVPPPPPPPPPPKAPPLPFTFVGLLERGAGKPAAFLARGEALLVVSAGDVIENEYRVESLSSTEVVLTYLPLNERQNLGVSGARP